MAIVFHVEPAPHLGIAVKRDDVLSYRLIMIPNRLLALSTDPWWRARLLAKVESLAISHNQISFDQAFGTAGKRDAGLRPPCAGGRGKSVAKNHIVHSVQSDGNLVENAPVLVVRDETLAHDTTLVANIKPDAVAA